MNSIFSANEPSLGYLYQVRYGLLLIVSEQNQDAKLLIEQIDDISIETPSTIEVYQTKLHINSVANLTNASTDLWKTIRVWSEAIKSGQLDPDNCIFNLITTAAASADTIPFKLKQGTSQTREVEELLKSLLEVATTSDNKTNKAAYAAFVALPKVQQEKLIKNISVIDSSIDLNEAKEGIKKRLFYSITSDRVEALYHRLEGWFVGEVILQLQNQRAEITGKDVQDKILDIADSLKADNLPADFTVSIASDEEQLSPYRNKIFVKQLDAVGVNSKLINHAISDYHRAFSQKSKWLRDGLINPTDEMHYDEKLIDDWERKFAILEDIASTDDETKKTEGKKFYESHYVKSQPSIHIKERFKEQYMVTGSCQILSDKRKLVGILISKRKYNMLPNWENRPEITAHLINPAFCGEIMRVCASAYKEESNNNFPFALSVLVLPLILNNGIRGRLPKNKSNTIHGWINENEDLKIGLANSITSFIPFTRETVMFAIAHNSLSIDENGNIDIKPRRKKFKTEDEEINSCLKKAEVIGKVFSKSGNPLTIYSILGIKP